MIFLSNAEGVITAAIPEPINQGSVGVNRIVLIAPFPSTSVVSATFTLPNGIKIYPRYVGETYNRPYLMGVVEAFSDKMLTIDGVAVNAWQLTLDKAITSVAGNVTVQFLVTTAAGTTALTDENGKKKTIGVIIPGTEQTLATTSATLPINRGNAYLAPSVSDKDINTIVEYLAAAKQAKINAEAAKTAAETAKTDAEAAQGKAEAAQSAAASSASSAASSATAAASSARTANEYGELAVHAKLAAETAEANAEAAEANAKVAQKKAEEAANRASPWDLVITPRNASDVLADWTRQKVASSILFFNIDFSKLVTGDDAFLVFDDSTRKLEFRGCTFEDEQGNPLKISFYYSGPQCSIKGAKGDELVIQGFTDVIDCRANIIKDCQYVTACDAVTLDGCQCVSDTTASTFTNCIFVDPFTVKGFVPATDNGKVPTLSQGGGYVPKQLPAKIVLAVDDQYIVTATLKDVNNNDIDSATIDLPLESVVVKATVSEEGGQKFLILTLQNGEKTKIPLEDIFKGLATETWVNAQISAVNATINGIGTRVTALENGLETAETDISTLKEDMSAAETEIDELKRSKLDSKGLTHSFVDNDSLYEVRFNVGKYVKITSTEYSSGDAPIEGSVKVIGESGSVAITPSSLNFTEGDESGSIDYTDIATKSEIEQVTEKFATKSETNYEFEQVRNDISNFETETTNLKKRVDNIEGAAIDFVADSTDAVTKTVPTDALPYAKIMKIGGKTYVADTPDGSILKSAPVTELVSEGTNLIPFPYTVGGVGTVRETYGITWTVNADGSITANGTATSISTFRLADANSFTLPSGVYTLSGCPSDGSRSSYYLIAGVSNNGVQVAEALDIGAGRVFNLTNIIYTGIRIDLAVKTGTVCNNLTFYPMLNKGSTALPYRPYFKSTFPIPESVRPLNGINANACDYIAWEADGTRKKYVCIAIVDASSLTWYYDSSTNVFYTASLNNEKATGSTNVLCTRYDTATVSWVNMGDKMIAGASGESVLRIKDTEYGSDLTSFRNSLAGVQIAYEMKTPTVTDISNILTADNYIEVGGGGTITARNGGYGAPTTIYYATEKKGG